MTLALVYFGLACAYCALAGASAILNPERAWCRWPYLAACGVGLYGCATYFALSVH